MLLYALEQDLRRLGDKGSYSCKRPGCDSVHRSKEDLGAHILELHGAKNSCWLCEWQDIRSTTDAAAGKALLRSAFGIGSSFWVYLDSGDYLD